MRIRSFLIIEFEGDRAHWVWAGLGHISRLSPSRWARAAAPPDSKRGRSPASTSAGSETTVDT